MLTRTPAQLNIEAVRLLLVQRRIADLILSGSGMGAVGEKLGVGRCPLGVRQIGGQIQTLCQAVEDADGTTFVRNPDGSWNRTGPEGFTTRAYNLKVDAGGNVTYEQNLFGMSDEAKQRSPLFRTSPRFRVNEYTDGRRREGLA